MSAQSDLREPVAVSLTLADWAEVIAAMGDSPHCTIETKARVNQTIFSTVQRTERTLS